MAVTAFKHLSKNIQFCVNLLMSDDMRLVDKASQNMIGIVQIWTMLIEDNIPISLKRESVTYLMHVI